MIATQMPVPADAAWRISSSQHYHQALPSPSSSDSSSSDGSVFSVDAHSQSSDSSVGSLHNYGLDHSWPSRTNSSESRISKLNHQQTQPLIIPAEGQQHHRRCSASQAPRAPPSLTRGTEKKGQFVEHLVDSAAVMVDIIWPTSTPHCFRDAAMQQPHLSLRTFIQETLRRSRTSFSTLQVALYYLLLIRAFVPKFDFTMEQPVDSQSVRALQCGRRMFLAALILASKYLQDRNYSARAWSKISGLPVCEINTNEMAFLKSIDWKLHIPESTFDKWQSILIQFTSPRLCDIWKRLVLTLPPSLDKLPRSAQDVLDMDMDATFARRLRQSMSQSSTDSLSPISYCAPSSPMCISGPPAVLEPTPSSIHTPPRHAPLATLATPNFTPASSVCPTPAASLANFSSQRPSAMSSAMCMAQNVSLARTVNDSGALHRTWSQSLDAYRLGSRRPSAQFSVECMSASSPGSPGSMISDHSSQFSRSSSISSISSNQPSPTRSRDLARLAAFNCGQKIPECDSEVVIISSAPLSNSPEFDSNLQIEPADIYVPQHSASANLHGKKRNRSITSTQSFDLQSQVRGMLSSSISSNGGPLRSQYPNAVVASRLAAAAQFGNKRPRYEETPVQQQMPKLQENMYRPTGGPGMWKGIL